MGLMDSINIQYIWKAIQESERSDENLCPNTTLSDWLTQTSQSTLGLAPVNNTSGAVPLEGCALLPSQPKPDASSPSRR